MEVKDTGREGVEGENTEREWVQGRVGIQGGTGMDVEDTGRKSEKCVGDREGE